MEKIEFKKKMKINLTTWHFKFPVQFNPECQDGYFHSACILNINVTLSKPDEYEAMILKAQEL